MKISWGYIIVMVYSCFVLGIMTMVYLSAKENRDLVSENYYAEEIAYQNVIDQSSKAAALSAPVELTVSANQLTIQLPHEFIKLHTKGHWTLYYAADKKRDISGTFGSTNGIYHIQIPAGKSGQFLFKLQWESGNTAYYFEKPIVL